VTCAALMAGAGRKAIVVEANSLSRHVKISSWADPKAETMSAIPYLLSASASAFSCSRCFCQAQAQDLYRRMLRTQPEPALQ
jgi:hypothetical protein